MRHRHILVLGGTGFVGHHLLPALARQGCRIRLASRHPERHRDLQLVPDLRLVQALSLDRDTLPALLEGCDAVINLVGILNEKGDDGRGFQAVHADLPQRLAEACVATGVRRLLHMSALGAGRGSSHYLGSKGEGEDRVHAFAARGLQVTSFQPSVIFGRGDSFFNRFAGLLRLTPAVFPLACPDARFAPVWAGDVASAFVQALDDRRSFGQRYPLCGPRAYTLRQLVQYTARVCGLERWILPLPDALSRLQANLLEYAPGKPFSRDNYRSLQTDSLCQEDGLARLGIPPSPLEAIVPTYLPDRIHAPDQQPAERTGKVASPGQAS